MHFESVTFFLSLLLQAAAPSTPLPDCPQLAGAIAALVRNDARLRDWAEIARYRDANRQLPPPSASAARVVFMGDSITDIWQQPRFGFFVAGKPYVDRGISGQTTPQMLVRFRPDVIDLQPKAVVILAGTNDIAGNTGPMTNEEIEENVQSMAELASAHGIKVVLSSILPVSDYHVQPSIGVPQTTLRPMDRIKALNEWMKSYAAAHGHVYLDYFSSMLDDRGLLRAELSEDDLHPNAKGYAIMAPLAEAAIQKAVRSRLVFITLAREAERLQNTLAQRTHLAFSARHVEPFVTRTKNAFALRHPGVSARDASAR